eukprot:3283942-Pyramimonas_sp.AAC.1
MIENPRWSRVWSEPELHGAHSERLRCRGGPARARPHLGARGSTSEAHEVPSVARGTARGSRSAVRPFARARP